MVLNRIADRVTCSSPELFKLLTRGLPVAHKASGDGAGVREAIPLTIQSR